MYKYTLKKHYKHGYRQYYKSSNWFAISEGTTQEMLDNGWPTDYAYSLLNHDLDIPTLFHAHVGSSFINQKLTNDFDIIFLCSKHDLMRLVKTAENHDLLIGGSFGDEVSADDVTDTRFRSFRKSYTLSKTGEYVDINIIVLTESYEFFRFRSAAEVCRMLASKGIDLDKDTRVALHEMLRKNLTHQQLLERANLNVVSSDFE